MNPEDKINKISIVIPVFNERENLEELYQRLRQVLNSLGKDYEIILVDDGSRDGSLETMKELRARDDRIVVVQLSRNFGQHPALAAGLSQARGDVAVIMDADLQNPPEEIPKLLRGLDQGYDLAYGIRKGRQDGLGKRLGSWTADLLMKLLLGEKSNISPFLAVRRVFVDAYNSCPERDKFFTGLFTWLGAKNTGVEVEHSPRRAGSTKYSFRKLIRLVITMTISFTEAPLRLASWAGFLVSLIGLILALKVVIQKMFLQITVPGYTSIFAAIVFFGGVQLFFLGVIGEYLSRVYIESRRRPDFVIRQVLKKSEDEKKSG